VVSDDLARLAVAVERLGEATAHLSTTIGDRLDQLDTKLDRLRALIIESTKPTRPKRPPTR
jgi:hypothetical protein